MPSPPEELRDAIESFLRQTRAPALLEPGEDVLPLVSDSFSLDLTNARLTLQAWDDRRNLARRITAVESERPGRLELTFERFGKRTGTLAIIDTARPQLQPHALNGHRKVFREQFRRFLSRQFCGWKIAELSAGPDLEHSLSPAYPRGFVRQGSIAWAAIAASPECTDPAACLTFGLIWLDYLRAREPRLTVAGLAVFVPDGRHRSTALRIRLLDPQAAKFALFLYTADGHEHPADTADSGNLDTHLAVCRQAPGVHHPLVRHLSQLPHVETVPQNDGSVVLRVRGLPFAVHRNGQLLFGLNQRQPASESSLVEIETLAAELARIRSPRNRDTHHPLYRRCPEAWLESQVRANLPVIDASLRAEPLYGQVPAFAGGDRAVIDLLAADGNGRLAVIELKASEDPHLPLQALDYWMRVEWHARHGDFTAQGYFPGIPLTSEPPRLLLVCPGLHSHPTAAVILRYFSPLIEVQRVGLGLEWQRGPKVVFRASGAGSPVWASEQDQQNADSNTE